LHTKKILAGMLHFFGGTPTVTKTRCRYAVTRLPNSL
jgi:hypothetical protein